MFGTLRTVFLTLLLAEMLGEPRGIALGKDADRAAQVAVETAEAPDLADWGKQAGKLCEEWYPKLAALLASDGYAPHYRVRLVLQQDKKGVAGTAGDTIYVAAAYVREHRDDFGMVIHELVHVIQAYPKYEHGWLVEGIADYVRFYHFEPAAKLPPIDRARAKYRDGYKTSAQFLAWVVATYDKQLVVKLNAALRQGRYTDELFSQATSHSLDDLWAEFVQSPSARGR